MIRLAIAPVTVEGVEVQADRSAVVLAADRVIYSTKDMPAASGGAAADVLRSVPELQVDLNGRVRLRGSAVSVYINGRPAPMRGEALRIFLLQFPANRIERVEVMANPSARFEAEGAGGIVNLVLKDETGLGLSGSASLHYSPMGKGGSGRLAYQEGPLTLFGGVALNLSRYDHWSDDFRANLAAHPVTYLRQHAQATSRGTYGMFDLTGEIAIGERTTLWSTLTAYGNDAGSEGRTSYTFLGPFDVAKKRYIRDTHNDGRHLLGDIALGIRHQFPRHGQELSVELRGRSGGQDRGAELRTEPLMSTGGPAVFPADLTRNDVAGDDRAVTLQVDYTRDLLQGVMLETGYKGSFRSTTNDYAVERFSPPSAMAPDHVDQTSFRYRQRLHAVYLTVGWQFAGLSLEGGVRAERAETELRLDSTGQMFSGTSTGVFPNISLLHDLGSGVRGRFTYSKRIERPSPAALVPHIPSVDPLNRKAGNPEIEPTYTQGLSLDLSWTGQMGNVRLSPFYRWSKDDWAQIKTVDSAGAAMLKWQNVASWESYGASLTASFRSLGPLSGFASLSGYRAVKDASNLSPPYVRKGLHWAATLNASAEVAQGLTAQWMVRYTPARLLPQGRISSTLLMDMGARVKLWGDRVTLNGMVRDPFDLWDYSFETRGPTHVQTSENSWSMRTFVLRLSYHFGRSPEETMRHSAEIPDRGPRVKIH